MELTNMLEHHIEQRDTRLVNDTIYEILKVQNKKWMLVDFLINLYCRDYISRNIWILKEFDKIFEQLESNRNNVHFIVNLASILCQLEKKPINLWNENVDVTLQDISLIQEDYRKVPNLLHSPDLKDSNPKVWELLNIVYYNLIDKNPDAQARNRKINQIFTIIRFFLSNNQKIFKPPGQNKNSLGIIPLDSIDHLFLVIKHYIDNNDVEPGILDYIILSKNLFFYKIKKKYKKHRINIVFYCFYIIITQKTKNFKIQYDDFSEQNGDQYPVTSNDKSPVPEMPQVNYDYMFVMLDIDPELVESAAQAKIEKKKYDTSVKKRIEMDMNARNSVISSISKRDYNGDDALYQEFVESNRRKVKHGHFT